MKRIIVLVLLIAGMAIAQTAAPGTPSIIKLPDVSDSVDKKVYVPPVPACTVIYYPVLRDVIPMGKNDKIRVRVSLKPKDSADFTTIWTYTYKFEVKDSGNYIINARLVPRGE